MITATEKSAPHPFMNSKVIKSLSNGVVETIRVMAQMTTKPEKAFVEKSWNPPTDISVFVDLASPPNSGQIRFHFPDNVLVSICKKMLNEDVSPGSPEVLDCAGELSNMFYGFAKSKLNEDGYSFKLSLPQPTKTEKLPDPNSSYSYIIIPFKVLDETCFIQIIIL